MIVIQSSADDLSTRDVMDWLLYLERGVSIARFDGVLSVDNVSLYIGDNEDKKSNIVVNGQRLDITSIKSSWFRRGEFIMQASSQLKHWGKLSAAENSYTLDLIDDLIFPGGTSINKFADVCINKLQCLSLAQSIGLDVPATLVTTQFNTLLQFAKEKGPLILKPIGTPFFTIALNERYSAHIVNQVSLVSYEQLIALEELYPDNIVQTTFAQQYVEKKWEIRTMFLDNSFYSMAIFSQQNEKTKIDFRNYDDERPNRCLPYKLPDAIEEKLSKLMNLLHINCGSIDMIYTPQKQYVFLEVNPIGQYQWLSQNCNYFIDKMIATQLLHNRADENYSI